MHRVPWISVRSHVYLPYTEQHGQTGLPMPAITLSWPPVPAIGAITQPGFNAPPHERRCLGRRNQPYQAWERRRCPSERAAPHLLPPPRGIRMICGHTRDHPGTFAWPEFISTFSIRWSLPSYSTIWSRNGSCPLYLLQSTPDTFLSPCLLKEPCAIRLCRCRTRHNWDRLHSL